MKILAKMKKNQEKRPNLSMLIKIKKLQKIMKTEVPTTRINVKKDKIKKMSKLLEVAAEKRRNVPITRRIIEKLDDYKSPIQ